MKKMKLSSKTVANENVKFASEYTLGVKEKKVEWAAPVIKSSRDANEYIQKLYSDDIDLYESFYLLLLNSRNKIKGHVKISQGGVSGTVADPKLIMLYAAQTLSTAVILVHNHPSGNLKPSVSDIKLTRKIKDALNLIDVSTLDHIISTSDGYYSFADMGEL